MPELPDVENFKRYFKKNSLDKKIVDVLALAKNLIKGITFADFKKILVGSQFSKIDRKGKYLISELKNREEKIIFHFGMTGSFKYIKKNQPKPEYSKITFVFENQDQLHFVDPRLFGKIWLVEDIGEISSLKKLGQEPLQISEKEFLALLHKQESKNIKAFFLDQSQIAGIGNFYSDEIIFRAKINPHCRIKEIKQAQRKKLYEKMKWVIQEAIKVGPPEGKFNSSWLVPHRSPKGDMICPNNSKHQLKKETIAGRSSVYCPQCQK